MDCLMKLMYINNRRSFFLLKRIGGLIMLKHLRLMVGVLLFGIVFFLQHNAECAIFDTKMYDDGKSRVAVAAELFRQSGKEFFIYIYKDCIYNPNRGDYSYFYKISFEQPMINNYINVSKIIVMSESMDITLFKDNNTSSFTGIDSRTDMLATSDTGRLNMVLLTARKKLLIRVVDKYNYYYDFYATDDLINKSKNVANWS